MPQYDAIVIGGGHNGLACACYLARAGLSTLVLERYHEVGGMTLTEELTLPGFRSDLHASGYQLANLSPAIDELEILEHGVEVIEPDVVYAHAFPDGRGLAVSRDLNRTLQSIGQYSQEDARAWRTVLERYQAGKQEFISSFFSPPPTFSQEAAASEGSAASMDSYRFSLQSVRSWCDETLQSDEVKALVGAFGLFVGAAPDDGGGAPIASLFGMVLEDSGNNLVKGGMHQVSLAMAADLREHGGEIRTSSAVDRILLDGDRATGVRLESGEEVVASKLVVSATDPRQTILRFLGAEAVGPEIAHQMERYEWGDASMVIYLALDGEVAYTAGPEIGQACHVHLSPASLDGMALNIVQCRAGQLPQEPLIVSWNDSTLDPSRVPVGKAHKKFVVLGVPYEIKGDATGRVTGTGWDEVKERYADYLIDLADRHYMPGLKSKILKRVVHSPLDMERILSSAVRGTISHGAMVPYQMGFMRPLPALAHYRSPVPNVYLADSGSHPGPGVSMAAGRNAAQVIYGDLGLDFQQIVQSSPAGH